MLELKSCKNLTVDMNFNIYDYLYEFEEIKCPFANQYKFSLLYDREVWTAYTVSLDVNLTVKTPTVLF